MSYLQSFYNNKLPEEFDVTLIVGYNGGVYVAPRFDTVYQYACPMNYRTAEYLIRQHLHQDLDLSNVTDMLKLSDGKCKSLARTISAMFQDILSTRRDCLLGYLGNIGYNKFHIEYKRISGTC